MELSGNIFLNGRKVYIINQSSWAPSNLSPTGIIALLPIKLGRQFCWWGLVLSSEYYNNSGRGITHGRKEMDDLEVLLVCLTAPPLRTCH